MGLRLQAGGRLRITKAGALPDDDLSDATFEMPLDYRRYVYHAASNALSNWPSKNRAASSLNGAARRSFDPAWLGVHSETIAEL